VGTVDGTNDRVVGIVSEDNEEGGVSLGSGTYLYPQSVSPVPDSVSDDDAMTTMVAALSSVHCALPTLENVGGDDSVGGGIWGKAVVLGGGDMAAFAADGLAAMGADVTIVSTGKPKVTNKAVTVLPPAVGEEEEAFSSVLGTYDVLVDTLEYESAGMRSQLSRRCKCDRYISTLTKSQKVIRDKGVLFGPGKANDYLKDTGNKAKSYTPIVPPTNFGPTTVKTLLEKGVLFKQGGFGGKNEPFLRGWALGDFWEYASWPRDATADGDVRYGMPVKSEAEAEAEEEALMEEVRRQRRMVGTSRRALVDEYDDDDEDDEEDDESSSARRKEKGSPHVLEIDGIGALHEHVLAPESNAVLFLSAPWCRTCRSLKPGYNRMARMEAEEENGDGAGTPAVTFAKCEAVGKSGKDLSHFLDVEAVPAFVVFRGGQVWGEPLSLSRLPSPELDRALEILRAD